MREGSEGSEGAETTINAEITEIAERFDGVGPAEQVGVQAGRNQNTSQHGGGCGS